MLLTSTSILARNDVMIPTTNAQNPIPIAEDATVEAAAIDPTEVAEAIPVSDQPQTLVVKPEYVQPADANLTSVGWQLKLGLLLTIPLVGLAAVDAMLAETPLQTALGRTGFIALQAALCTPVVLVCGWPILARAWLTIRTRRPDFYTLAGLGIGAAFTFSLVALVYDLSSITVLPKPTTDTQLVPEVAGGVEVVAPYGGGVIAPFFEGAAVMVVLVLLGLALENRRAAQTGEAIRKLIRLAPPTARVLLSDGSEEERPLEQVNPGDLVRVRQGERIPVDGVVRDGNTTVDESILTGEAMRTGKRAGSMVMAGTENGLGPLTVEVLRVNDQTAFAHIVALVGRAQMSRAPLHRTADRIAVWLIPLAIILAAATYAGWMLLGPPNSSTVAGVCAIGVLVAACPVALGLAAPTAVVAGMRRAARAGVLFRDGAALEQIVRVDTMLFDKTGTLTEGRMDLIGVEANLGSTPEEVIALAAAVERGSIHPIGLAIVWEAAKRCCHRRSGGTDR